MALPDALGGARVHGSASDSWRTPPELFHALRDELALDLDVAATSESALCSRSFCIDRGEDGLILPWSGRAFCNPPFSALGEWARRAWREVVLGPAECVAFVCPARTETAWFRYLAAPQGATLRPDSRTVIGEIGPFSYYGYRSASCAIDVETRFLSPRVAYLRPDGSRGGSPAFGSAVVVLRRVEG